MIHIVNCFAKFKNKKFFRFLNNWPLHSTLLLFMWSIICEWVKYIYLNKRSSNDPTVKRSQNKLIEKYIWILIFKYIRLEFASFVYSLWCDVYCLVRSRSLDSHKERASERADSTESLTNMSNYCKHLLTSAVSA